MGSDNSKKHFPVVMSTVQCELDGYEHLTISYNVGISMAKLDKIKAEKNPGKLGKLLRVEVANWDFQDEEENGELVDVPVPSSDNGYTTASPLLLAWMFSEGFNKAIQNKALPNGLRINLVDTA